VARVHKFLNLAAYPVDGCFEQLHDLRRQRDSAIITVAMIQFNFVRSSDACIDTDARNQKRGWGRERDAIKRAGQA